MADNGDDGEWQTVSKKQRKPKATPAAETKTAPAAPAPAPAPKAESKATAAESKAAPSSASRPRPAARAQPEFPICFMCGTRHDLGECKLALKGKFTEEDEEPEPSFEDDD